MAKSRAYCTSTSWTETDSVTWRIATKEWQAVTYNNHNCLSHTCCQTITSTLLIQNKKQTLVYSIGYFFVVGSLPPVTYKPECEYNFHLLCACRTAALHTTQRSKTTSMLRKFSTSHSSVPSSPTPTPSPQPWRHTPFRQALEAGCWKPYRSGSSLHQVQTARPFST